MAAGGHLAEPRRQRRGFLLAAAARRVYNVDMRISNSDDGMMLAPIPRGRDLRGYDEKVKWIALLRRRLETHAARRVAAEQEKVMRHAVSHGYGFTRRYAAVKNDKLEFVTEYEDPYVQR